MKRPVQELRDELSAYQKHIGSRVKHIASGGRYDIISVHFRESDMAVCFEYSPVGDELVRFSRPVSEMLLDGRFVFIGGVLR